MVIWRTMMNSYIYYLSLASLLFYLQKGVDFNANFFQAFIHNDILNRITLSFLDAELEPKFTPIYARNARKTVLVAMVLITLFHFTSLFVDLKYKVPTDKLKM